MFSKILKNLDISVLLLFGASEIYLLQMINPGTILQWIEVLGVFGAGVGTCWIWWRKQEGKRLESIEKGQGQIVNGYNSLLEEFQASSEEKEKENKRLVAENRKFFNELNNYKLIIKQQQGVIESLKFFNKTLLNTNSEEMRQFLKTSPIMDLLNTEKSIREILLERVERDN
ncbi:MAG: hypothetical protein J7647_01625 [Cyanobacteria bacterium SBLK]|nr:hypothetical protein [Cyanobacteria bacterium SBLK]